MAGPWEKYKAQDSSSGAPWEKYRGEQAPPMAPTDSGLAEALATPETLRGIDPQLLAQSKEGATAALAALPAPLRAMVGIGGAVDSGAKGLKQIGAYVADSVLPRADGSSRYQEAVQREDIARALDPTRTDTAARVGRVAGDVGMLAFPSSKVAAMPSLAARIGGNAAIGGAYAGLQSVGSDESRGANVALGGALGAGGELAAKGLGVMARRSANAIGDSTKALAQRAKDAGIPLHISQISESPLVRLTGSMSKYLPFSGAAKAGQRQQEAFNAAVGRTFGADAPKLTDEVMDAAGRSLSEGYRDVYSRMEIPIDAANVRRLAGAVNDQLPNLEEGQGRVLGNQLDRILSNATDGTLSGQKYQALRTQMLSAEKGGGVTGNAVRNLRKALDEIAEGSALGDDAARLRVLRGQYANKKLAESALKRVSGSGGDIRPADLWSVARNGSTKEMRELAKIGQMLKDGVPDSGTAQRSAVLSAMLGGGAVTGALPLALKAALAGPTVGRVFNSPLLADFALREGRGQAQNALATLSRPGLPAITPFVYQQERIKKPNKKP